MQRAIAETERRRQIQHAYNQQHGITPKGINKAVEDIMQLGQKNTDRRRHNAALAQVAEPTPDYHAMAANQLTDELKQIEERMYQHARDLEFEQAAALRDRLQQIKQQAGLKPA